MPRSPTLSHLPITPIHPLANSRPLITSLSPARRGKTEGNERRKRAKVWVTSWINMKHMSTNVCTCSLLRRTICHSRQSEVWKWAPGCESALHSSPESLRFRKHLIPSLTLRAPVRATVRDNEAFWTAQQSELTPTPTHTLQVHCWVTTWCQRGGWRLGTI